MHREKHLVFHRCAYLDFILVSSSSFFKISHAESPHPPQIEVELELTLPEISIHSMYISKPDCRVKAYQRDSPEGHTQEIPILGKEAVVVHNPAPDDVALAEFGPVNLIIAITSFLATDSAVRIRVLSITSQSEITRLSRLPYGFVICPYSYSRAVQAGSHWSEAKDGTTIHYANFVIV